MKKREGGRGENKGRKEGGKKVSLKSVLLLNVKIVFCVHRIT
jgi:hypothetical protein